MKEFSPANGGRTPPARRPEHNERNPSLQVQQGDDPLPEQREPCAVEFAA